MATEPKYEEVESPKTAKPQKKEERAPVLGEEGFVAPSRNLNYNDYLDAKKAKNSPPDEKILESIFDHNSKFSASHTGTPDLRLLAEMAKLLGKRK